MNVFQNQAQRSALQGYQTFGRRINRRGGTISFALPSDLAIGRRSGFATPVPYPIWMAGSQTNASLFTRHAFKTYGGFGSRQYRRHGGDVSSALARRYALLEATALTAPVVRANLQHHTVAGLPAPVDRTPFKAGTSVEEANPSPPALGERLGMQVLLSHRRVLHEAWGLFQDGAYRRAARAFESAYMLEPEDSEARIGELFCYVSLGATVTALTTVVEINEHDLNPFLHELHMADRYERAEEPARVRLQIQLQAEVARQNATVAALHALVMWYLDAHEEAMSIAALIKVNDNNGDFAHWPEQMRLAESAPSITDRP